MDAKTGLIHQIDDLRADEKHRAIERRLIPLTDHEARTAQPMSNGRRKNWMRNKPCICGSGKKFKVCCWSKYQ